MRRLAGSLSALVLGLGLLEAMAFPALVATPASAQSAADKATARTLAREGIDLFKAGKHADALDRLQRAQALYDAPVHLLYIARCQAKLGLVVEAAESYRKLVRTELPGNAPEAFKEAVEDARKELPEVEPKIAQLRIEVEPKGLSGLKLTIDQAEVSDAVVGVDRPTNPGSRKVTVRATGYKPAEQVVELKPGEKKAIKLALQVDPDATAEAGEKGTGKGETAAGQGASSPEQEPSSGLGFIVGLRLGGLLPLGKLTKEESIADYFGSAGGGELRGGIRFAQRYSVLLLGGGATHKPGEKLKLAEGDSTVKATPVSADAGVGFMYAPPRGKLGPYGELAVLFVHRIDSKRDVTLANGSSCQQTLTASGQALRLGGGAQIPVNGWFQLSPYMTLTLGQMTEFTVDKVCGGPSTQRIPWDTPGAVPADQRAVHAILGLGIGGDILFGSDKPKK